ncbi:hypothetical protein G7Y89_g6652 [Cudoniella acicularis]|uniref:GrpB family protein n=1 Tax=Cudoniella acicularis TaxID=354080 RepID=A0A8H4W4J9_9HELO|nr:hypothetical protein G7Y89_g6652 [Cudoniella acicularis]
MRVVIEPHNPIWITRFNEVKNSLAAILEGVPIIGIEHVGSTSVPDLPAKPVLDIDIVIDAENIAAARKVLVSRGYTDLGEVGIADRYAFRQPGFKHGDGSNGTALANGIMRMNTYVVLEGSLALRNHRDLKRVLLEDAGLRKEYGDVKLALAKTEFSNVDEYCDAKDEIILKILRRASWSEKDLGELKEKS